jgi:hypothetical protein
MLEVQLKRFKFRQRLQDFDACRNDFLADAVAGDGRDAIRFHRLSISKGGVMRRFLIAVVAIALSQAGVAADIDRSAVDFTLAKDIKWVRNAAGTNESAILFGDPSKPGPYVVRLKWLPGNMSRPHFHPNDRFFTVISGTWWVGTGEKFDPESTVPVPAGSYVVHYGQKIHYDGAKGEECVIQVWGVGPATSVPAEKK